MIIKSLVVFSLLLATNAHALFFPIVSYSDETGTILGLFTQKELKNSANLQLMGMTQNKGQMGMVNLTNLPVQNERINIRVFGSNTGTSYYGIANTNKKSDDQTLYFSEFKTALSIEKPLYKSWDLIAGLSYNTYKENRKNNRATDEFNELHDVGIELGIQMDKRNSEYNATTGYFNEIKAEFYPRHTKLSNDVRSFIPLPHNATWANRLYIGQTITDTAHIQYYQAVGSYYHMRGYRSNDIMDKFLAFGQTEWRKKITSWLTISPFLEVGTIGSSPSNTIKGLFSYGVGTYFPLGAGAFRLEIASAEQNSEFYFGFNHVF